MDFKLGAKEEKVFYSVIGNMRDLKTLNNTIPKITASGYLARKKEENRNIIRELQSDIDTHSSRKEFDLYAKQTYLDNIIRGGYPITFKSNTSSTVFYLYSRKHGDLERDYNKFQLQPVYLSQGNGNYRDMNQNQRSDIWFNPDIADESIINFLSLIQTDGFNPLVIKGANFTLTDEGQFRKSLKNIAEEKYTEKIMDYLKKPFTPGEIIFFIEENKIRLKVSYDEFLNILLGSSLKHQEAEHGEGFWTDHWTYNLDLLENFLGIYPEKLKEIAFEKRVFTFYDNTEIVKPRKEKYILKDELIKQLHSIAPDGSKRELIRKRSSQPHLVRTQYGLGEIYQTTLFNKLLCLLANKLASLDPFGIGIEMEANKPNWFDALNGLPALFGSSLCETFELKRLILSLRYILDNYEQDKIKVTEEIYKFLNNLNNLIKDCRNASSGDRDYKYWNDSYALKEDYRLKTKLGLSGNELEVEVSDLSAIFENALEKVSSGIAKALDKEKNIFPSYFFYKVTEHQVIKDNFIRPIKFKQVKLPLFLEGQMHALRLSENIQEAALLHKATRKSALFDKELKMYKVTAPLKSMPEEIGRCRVFAGV
ncbi:MAG: hypothetical protein NTW13_06755 [Candidatus Omnitrophica bacterium]|nr:hypothetical protein [Candidatus Omnitrophota bacterium]